VLKDIDGYLRGREPGAIPALLRDELLLHGVNDDVLTIRLREIDALREALAWARAGDLLVMPLHSLGARAEADALLDSLEAAGWRAGDPLPPAADAPAQ
jgi:cyanophycin synthetase